MSLELYNHLTVYGLVYDTNHFLPQSENFVAWSEENFDYVHYNPRKDIKRYGLSITSLDGGTSGVPLVYEHPDLKKILDPIRTHLFRSHIIRLDSGGFFPPHRDFGGLGIDSFRLIIPLQNTNVPEFTFIVDGKIQHWVNGRVYFVDTAKMHYLFNSGFKPTYFIVLNVELNKDTLDYVTKELYHG
jgi:hypothetical protein